MKTLIQNLLLLLFITFVVGCGGAGGKSSGNDGATITIPMQIGVAVPIDGGYKLLSSDPDAVVDIIIIDNNKTATLISGEASIEKPI